MIKIAEQIKVDYAVLRPDEQIPAHVQDSWEIAYVILGRGMRTIGDTTEPFAEGDVVLIPPGMTHEWIFDPAHTDRDGNISDTALMFNPSLFSDISDQLPDFSGTIKSITCRKEAMKFEGAPRKMIQKLLLRLAKTDSNELKATYFLSLITIIGAALDYAKVAGHNTVSSPSKRKVEKVRIFCECNYMKRISLNDATRHAGMNISSFCKFFLRNFNCTFTDYINRLRVNEACRLLKTSEEHVAGIAYSVGFNSVPYFNRVFQRQCGCTPSQYRLRHKTIHNEM